MALGRDDNFWQSGPTGPCGPCSELYLDRGLEFGGPTTGRATTPSAFEFWNLVFMQYELHADGSLTDLAEPEHRHRPRPRPHGRDPPGRPSVFETDLLSPLVELGEELSGRSYGQDFPTTRALRILADHGRAATFLLADGVVPSNEDRGYILRRIMRRTMQQGRVLGLDEPLPRAPL